MISLMTYGWYELRAVRRSRRCAGDERHVRVPCRAGSAPSPDQPAHGEGGPDRPRGRASGVGAFARWAIGSERESFARANARRRPVGADRQISYADASAGGELGDRRGRDLGGGQGRPGRDPADDVPRPGPGRPALDLRTAGPGQLSGRVKGVVFTDGPSPSPQIVERGRHPRRAGPPPSMSDSGLCFSVRLDGNGAVRFGTLRLACTGVRRAEGLGHLLVGATGRSSVRAFGAPD